jgi:CubicO group peptidase (beta-lactamase class C family)
MWEVTRRRFLQLGGMLGSASALPGLAGCVSWFPVDDPAISASDTHPSINGQYDKKFEPVVTAFAANFARGVEYRDVGAALVVYQDGARVVDVWAGHADRAGKIPWQPDTLVNLYSATKGVAALAAARLFQEGRIDYASRVVRYWPEFGQNGKEQTTVADLLSHRAGLTGFIEPTTLDELYDWHACCERLARQKPYWTPGTVTSYHAVTWGYLVGEVVRRVNGGESLGRYLEKSVARPLQADVYVGLPDELEPRVAVLIGPTAEAAKNAADLRKFWKTRIERDAIPFIAEKWHPFQAIINPSIPEETPNERAWRAAEIPAANGHASARGLARIYAALANEGSLDGVELLSPAVIDGITQVPAGEYDLFARTHGTRAAGLSVVGKNIAGEPTTFGHVGWGGCVGCANFESKIGLGYVTNHMGVDLNQDPRWKSICAATFEVAGVQFQPT